MKKFNVGIQLYGVRNAMAEDFEGTLKAISEMGYEYVEFAGYFGKSAEEIKAILDKYNLKCISVHQGLDFFDENPDEKCEFLKAFGVKYSVIPWYEQSKLAGSSDWEETKRKFSEAADLFKKHGMMLGYHNHEFEYQVVDGKYIHDYIFEAVPEDRIVPELDTCWVHYAGINPVDMINKYKGRVEIVHLKDFECNSLGKGPVYDLIDGDGKDSGKPKTREENGFKFRPLGMGRQNFEEILSACEKCGTETVIVEQDQTYDISELEAARISRQYLREKFGI